MDNSIWSDKPEPEMKPIPRSREFMKQELIAFLDRIGLTSEIVKDSTRAEVIYVPFINKYFDIIENISYGFSSCSGYLKSSYEDSVFIIQDKVKLITESHNYSFINLYPVYQPDTTFNFDAKAINVKYLYKMTPEEFKSMYVEK